MRNLLRDWRFWAILGVLAYPVIDFTLPTAASIGLILPKVLAFAFLGLGLHLVTGATGLLNLGAAAFVAVGAYAFAILTTASYPFHWGFWPGLGASVLIAGLAGLILGLPTMRLRGDYLAIVTLGFGEIVQDLLKNLDGITKGTQGIMELAKPTVGIEFPSVATGAHTWMAWYYLYLLLLAVVVLLLRNLERSRIGRAWVGVREDELAARCMGSPVARVKLLAFAGGSALCGLGGALYACLLNTSSDPSNYDFMLSVSGLCMVILGGLGSLEGALVGSLIIGGFNVIVMDKVGQLLDHFGWSRSDNVLLSLTNWKYLIFGLVLVLMMRYRPHGLLPERRGTKAAA